MVHGTHFRGTTKRAPYKGGESQKRYNRSGCKKTNLTSQSGRKSTLIKGLCRAHFPHESWNRPQLTACRLGSASPSRALRPAASGWPQNGRGDPDQQLPAACGRGKIRGGGGGERSAPAEQNLEISLVNQRHGKTVMVDWLWATCLTRHRFEELIATREPEPEALFAQGLWSPRETIQRGLLGQNVVDAFKVEKNLAVGWTHRASLIRDSSRQ